MEHLFLVHRESRQCGIEDPDGKLLEEAIQTFKVFVPPVSYNYFIPAGARPYRTGSVGE
jgi:hypothetical protein